MVTSNFILFATQRPELELVQFYKRENCEALGNGASSPKTLANLLFHGIIANLQCLACQEIIASYKDILVIRRILSPRHVMCIVRFVLINLVASNVF
jgi:hypothetical protein